MKEEFYAVIKLISGEEIFSKVCPCDEEDRILLILEDPVKIEKIKIRNAEIPVVRVHSWIEITDESMFVIDMKNVIMISESKDEKLISIHKKFVKSKYQQPGITTITEKMGYISSVDEARSNLEKLYNS